MACVAAPAWPANIADTRDAPTTAPAAPAATKAACCGSLLPLPLDCWMADEPRPLVDGAPLLESEPAAALHWRLFWDRVVLHEGRWLGRHRGVATGKLPQCANPAIVKALGDREHLGVRLSTSEARAI